MRFDSIYRISLYLLLFLASLILNLDADATLEPIGSTLRYPSLYPVVMALAGVIAFFTVDRRQARGLGPGTSNLLAASSLGLVYAEYKLDPDQFVLACGHWVYYLALVKMFRPKNTSDDWYLIVLALMQVLVGCYLSQRDLVGSLLILWAFLAIWVLSLFHLKREANHSGSDRGGSLSTGNGAGVIPEQDPYPGLFSASFFIATARASALAMVMGVIIFLLMPRTKTSAQPPRGSSTPRTLSGFSQEVQLGQMGEILDNDEVVFTAELFESGNRLTPDENGGTLLWRGVTLARYENGRWSRHRTGFRIGSPPTYHTDSAPSVEIEQRIRMEETAEDVLFAIRPIIEIQVEPPGLITMNSQDGTLIRDSDRDRKRLLGNRVNHQPLEYTIISNATRDGESPIQAGENDPFVHFRGGEDLLQVPGELLASLREISDRVVAGIPAERPAERARALERFLRDSGEFRYTLQMTRQDRSIDPNLDFLINTRRGHCEYFASALTLLLRSQGIPARIVNGFKGGDWNDLAEILTVRQRHAHSWVEAYLGNTTDQDRLPRWLTLDPAPPAERQQQVQQVARLPGNLRQLIDYGRYLWVFYVAGFNRDRQSRLIYQPIRDLIQQAVEGFRIMWRALANALHWMTDFPSHTDFFSIKGFVVSSVVMLLLAGVFWLLRPLWRRIRRRLGRADELVDTPSRVLPSYVRLLALLEEFGLQRPATETPREFAQRASVLLGDQARDTDGLPLSDVPAQIVESFYQVRYGKLPLPPEVIAQLDAQLDALEARLRPSAG